jgi:hypothetical protein
MDRFTETDAGTFAERRDRNDWQDEDEETGARSARWRWRSTPPWARA